jgi:xanthine dehydrogenase YagS FAD-binding subunit
MPMLPFAYERPRDVAAAVAAGATPGAYYVGGGTNLLDLAKSAIERPTRLVDVNHLGLDAIEEGPDGGLRIGAGARNSEVADDARVRERYPLLSQALLSGASPQLRNMATVGGNLLQRTRCDYFVDPAFEHCNKRKPGSGCAARAGFDQLHAILGASPHCIAVHPSDQNVALAALDAVVRVQGANGERTIPIGEFHRLPGDHPERDTNLQRGELIVAVDLPPSPYARHYRYLKVRERASYAFALVSVAVGLDVADGTIRSGRIALGGVAHKPWLAQQASDALAGQRVETLDAKKIAALALDGAAPLKQNGYKIPLAQNAIERALRLALEAAA